MNQSEMSVLPVGCKSQSVFITFRVMYNLHLRFVFKYFIPSNFDFEVHFVVLKYVLEMNIIK